MTLSSKDSEDDCPRYGSGEPPPRPTTDRAARAESGPAPASQAPVARRISDTAVADADATLSPEELRAVHQRDFVARLQVVDPKSYRITAEVGQGGIGRILRARDERLDRSVALKELLTNAGSAAEDRFVREALLTARLQHPSIVPLYEAGRWPTGEPFYAMKYVSGRSLADVIFESQTLPQRLALLPHVLAVAEAMAYAHSERIIHRDLKPANVLVGAFGETVVIDWGLAKDLAEASSETSAPEGEAAAASDEPDAREASVRHGHTPRPPASALTMQGAVMGTPAYMPLEQATGKRVDERVDVYALGAILYHLLAGACPYDGDTSMGILRKVVAGPPPPIEARQKGIPQDLLTIVKKAMAREPSDRYPSAKELADDLRRFQTGQIVGAHKYSSLERIRRFARRYRAAVSVGASAFVVLMIAGVIFMHRTFEEQSRAVAGENRALAAQKKAVEHADDLTLVQARAAVERDPNEALAWLKSLSPSFKRWPEARLIAADAEAQGVATVLRGHEAGVNDAAFSPDGKLLATVSDDRTARLWNVQTGESRVLAGHTDEVWALSFSPSGKLLATSSKDKSIRIWDTQTGEVQRTLTGHALPVPTVIFVDEDTITSKSDDHSLWIWDLRTGLGRPIAGTTILRGAPISPDRRLLALVDEGSKALQIYDFKTGELRSFNGHGSQIFVAAFSPDSKTVVTLGKGGVAQRWDLASGKSQPLDSGSRVLEATVWLDAKIRFSADSRLVAASGTGHIVRLWDLTTGASRTLEGHQGGTKSVSFSPDSTLLASGSDDHTVRLWDLARGGSRVLHGFEDMVGITAFSPDGKLLAAAGADFAVRLFPVAKTPSRILSDYASPLHDATFSPDGERVLTSGNDGQLRLFEVASGAVTLLSGHKGPIHDQVFSPSGELIASGAEDGNTRVWDTEGHQIWAFESAITSQGTFPIWNSLVFSPDGHLLAAPGRNKDIVLLDVDSGTRQHLSEGGPPTAALAFSPDGKVIAAGSRDGTIWLWDLAGHQRRLLGRHDQAVFSLAFSPDGKLLASGSQDHTLRFWDMETGESRKIYASGGGISPIVFSRDGRRVISLGYLESGVRVWNVATGAEIEFLRGHAGPVGHFSLSPKEDQVATAGTDATVRLWDLGSGQSRALRGHVGATLGVAFSPDGKLIASVGADRTLRLWPDDLPEDGAALRGWIEAATPDTITMYHRCTEEFEAQMPVR